MELNVCNEAAAEIERLRELLEDVLHDMVFDGLDHEGKTELMDRVAEEVGDEVEM
jgi:hypothetical protein